MVGPALSPGVREPLGGEFLRSGPGAEVRTSLRRSDLTQPRKRMGRSLIGPRTAPEQLGSSHETSTPRLRFRCGRAVL